MKSNDVINNSQNSSCRCGSSLQLDVLSLNCKLLGSDPKNFYCLTCMADLFECTVDDVVGKLDAFKREGCRLFPASAASE
jgi:hypothetical protein